jgi:hypothetical protein
MGAADHPIVAILDTIVSELPNKAAGERHLGTEVSRWAGRDWPC